MAGHSKWANIKHKKARQDANRGKIFTKIAREIIVAVRQGGSTDPSANVRLRMALAKARAANMPNDNINRAISRAAGSADSDNLEEITYEGYGPGGVAIMLDILTDNRNRTASEIRYIFSRKGGSLGETGCVAWMFKRMGQIFVAKENSALDEEELMLVALEAGAEDVRDVEQGWEIITAPEHFEPVREALEARGVEMVSAEITMLPDTTVDGPPEVMELIEALEEHDDVQNVYTNWNMAGTD
ncbi:MAG: YebC/PmpR family DNA-binding transcriptional regulator [Firmicutes bacterium]|nr:YebC/PmpR family DNA-binding transcriptional regulator [Bacillota bacterium]HOB34824.1 YebC/PmpR family DNA-binding transcriptional regulator [Bacillota bacterium]HPZ90760.1 YebC/PmpR family DNA-binding transcriptional regulator [Bacillota bacterium]HQE01714.1 YebC/PmpR family DNA-binding transcriptional regulator [Bacillota bacterium]